MPKLPVYLDYNATTPCDPRVVNAMLPYFTDRFGNAASRDHAYGWEAQEAVKIAREQVAGLIGAEPKEIIFTSGATESINLAIKGVFEAYAVKGNHIITCNIEHNAVLDTCRHLEKRGAEITWLEVKKNGSIDLSELKAAIRPSTILVAVMYANNEIGTIMPVKQIGDIARAHNIIFFSDATQAVGKIPVDVNADNIDLLSLSSHKMYGPKGVGALFVRRKNPRVRVTAQIHGGGHENDMRSGTLNVPGIVGFGKASELCKNEMQADADRLRQLRDKLERSLLKVEETCVNGNKQQRLPHTTNVSFNYVEGTGLVTGLCKNVAIATGSACTSASPEPSHVLKALGLRDDLAHSSIRFSLGRFTTEEEIEYTIEQVKAVVRELREKGQVWKLFKQGVDMGTGNRN